jgi:AP-1 complex subunit beta-1
VAALGEIAETSVQRNIFVMNETLLQKLLAALNECTEYVSKYLALDVTLIQFTRWGQISILNSLANYQPQNAREAGDIIERVIPRLQHANASVVLSAVKVLVVYLGFNFGEELERTIVRKLAPPLGNLHLEST